MKKTAILSVLVPNDSFVAFVHVVPSNATKYHRQTMPKGSQFQKKKYFGLGRIFIKRGFHHML